MDTVGAILPNTSAAIVPREPALHTCTISDIGQFDGQGESKSIYGPKSNKSGMPKRVLELWRRLRLGLEQESDDADDTNVEAINNLPMTVISPKPTNVRICEPSPRRLFSIKPWSRRTRLVHISGSSDHEAPRSPRVTTPSQQLHVDSSEGIVRRQITPLKGTLSAYSRSKPFGIGPSTGALDSSFKGQEESSLSGEKSKDLKEEYGPSGACNNSARLEGE